MFIKTFFTDHFKDHKLRLLLFTILVITIHPINSVLLSRLFGKLFDIINKNKKLPNLTNFYENIVKQNAPGIVLIICLVYVILYFIYISRNYLETLIIPEYAHYMRTFMFNKIIESYSTRYKDLRIGEIITIISEVKYAVVSLFQVIFDYFIATVSGIIFIIFYFSFIHWKIGLIYVVSILLIGVGYYFTGQTFLRTSIQKMKTYYNLNETVNDKLSNLMNIYLNNEDKYEMNDYKKKEDILKSIYMNNIWNEKTGLTISDAIIGISTIIIVITAYYLLKSNQLSTTNFISIIITISSSSYYLYNLNKEIADTIYYCGVIYSNKAFLDEIVRERIEGDSSIQLNKGKIEFHNVHFKYDDKSKTILKNLNYTIEPKSKIAIMGQSGSGKSTLMKLLIRLYAPTNGTIKIDGHDIQNIDPSYLRKKIIYVNQRTSLFNETVLKNIQYGTDTSEEKIKQILDDYDLEVVFSKLPFGLSSACGVNGNNLSLGMQKVIITLRGIFKPGLIYVFDEPLTSLDLKTKKKIIKLITNELKGKTIIVITHDKEIIPYMNKTININQFK